MAYIIVDPLACIYFGLVLQRVPGQTNGYLLSTFLARWDKSVAVAWKRKDCFSRNCEMICRHVIGDLASGSLRYISLVEKLYIDIYWLILHRNTRQNDTHALIITQWAPTTENLILWCRYHGYTYIYIYRLIYYTYGG